MPRTRLTPLLAALIALTLVPAAPAQKADVPLAGWYNVFPPNAFYLARILQAPVVGKDDTGPPAAYSQTMRYDAATGLVRAVDVTLARDPAFRERYAPATLRKLKDPPNEVKFGKRTAWVWKDGSRIVVPFAPDRALVIAQAPLSVGKLTTLPPAFDLDRIDKALQSPPRTDFRRTLETFRVVRKGDLMAAVTDWAGAAERVEKVGGTEAPLYRWHFALTDGSKVLVEGKQTKVEAVRHVTRDGKTKTLVE